MKKILVLFLVCFTSFTLQFYESVPVPQKQSARDSYFVKIPAIFNEISAKEEPLKILAFGDIMLGRYVRVLMEKNDLYYPFKKIFTDKAWLSQFDIITGNLEGPITERFVTGGTSTVFGFPKDTAQILKNLGFTCMNLANNHINDRGQEGYEETKKYLSDAKVGFFGNYNDLNKTPTYSTEIKGKKITFLGFNDTFGILDKEAAVNLVKDAQGGADYLIVFIHWGTEYQNMANKRQKELARAIVDAGADAVIGHHPHVTQEYEYYKDKPVFYSLGNFVFDQYFRSDVQEGLAVGLILDGDNVNFEVYKMKSVLSQPYFIEERS